MSSPYREFATPLSGGLATATDLGLIKDDQSPDLLNIDFRDETARKRNGSRKVNAIGVRSGGLRFDGVSGWLYVPDSDGTNNTPNYHITDVLTWECHVMFEALANPLGGSGQVLVSKYNNNPANQLAFVVMQTAAGGQRIQATWRQGADNTLTSTGAVIATGVRYHIAFVFASGRQNLFVTNLDTGATGHATSTFAGAISSITEPLLTGALGRDASGRVNFADPAVAAVPFDVPANMVIDEIRFWHAALQTGAAPSAAMSAYMNRELDTAHPDKANLLGYWRLNDRNGLGVNDDVLTINTTGTPATSNRGFLEPRHGSFVDGLLPDKGGFAVHLDGYTDYASVPVDSSVSANVGSAYLRAFRGAGTGVRPVWCIEFNTTVPVSTGVDQPIFWWVTDAVVFNVILTVTYDTANVRFNYSIGVQTQAGAADATLTLSGSSPLVAGDTIAVSVTRDLTAGGQTIFTVYENGVNVASTTTVGGETAGPDGIQKEIRFGSNNTLSGFAAIDIDEIRIWYNGQTANGDVVARSAAQIAQYFDKPLPQKEKDILTSGTPLSPGPRLIHYWTLDDNFRDYNDSPVLATNIDGTYAYTGASDSGGSQTITATETVLGGLPLILNPGSHVPEWAPGVIGGPWSATMVGGAVQGGLFDAVQTFKTSDGAQSIVVAAEGAILEYTATTLPGAFATLLASGFQGGRQASRVLERDRVYLTNGLSPPLAFDGTAVRRWGIQAPTFAPVSNRTPGGTSTAGDVQYRYTWISRKSGVETAPSPPSSIFRDQAALAPVTLALFHSPDPQVTGIRIYRTTHGATTGTPKPGSTEFYFVDEITNVTGQTTTSAYVDTVGDATLGLPLNSRDGFTVGEAPPWCQFAVAFNGRVFMANDPRDQKTRTRLFFSESLEPERFGGLNFIDIDNGEGEPITGLATLFDRLFIWKRSSIYVLSGTGPANFVVQLLSSGIGCFSHFGTVAADGWLYFLSDRGAHRTTGTEFEWIGQSIINTFQALGKDSLAQAAGFHVKDGAQVGFALPSASGLRNNIVLVYDYANKVWSIYSGIRAQCADTSIDQDGVNRVFTGDEYGFLYRLESTVSVNDGQLGFLGTVSGTITAVGTVASVAGTKLVLTDGAAVFHVADPDNYRGVRYEIEQASTGVTAEGRLLMNTGTTLTLDKSAAELGFTPIAGDLYRLMAIDAYITTKAFALGAPSLLKTVHETEYEMNVALDPSASATSIITTNTFAADYATLSGASTQTQADTAGVTIPVWQRFNTPTRGRRFQVKLANDRPNERFEIRTLTVRSVPDPGRT